MAEDVSIVGRKAFFIATDGALVPDSCLERLMSHGYESYRIADTGVSSMKKKVEDIIRLFPGCILYFCIDAKLVGIEWNGYIKELCATYRSDVKVGIVFKSHFSATDRYQLESFYYNEARITAGMLELTGNEAEDYGRILEALARAGARGRRKIVRVECDASSTVVFPDMATAKLKDISRTYFCCVFEEELEARVYDRFKGLTVSFNGMSFTSDAVLVMKHSRSGVNCGIFMFVKEDGSPELEPGLKEQLNKKIYSIVTAERRNVMERSFAGR